MASTAVSTGDGPLALPTCAFGLAAANKGSSSSGALRPAALGLVLLEKRQHLACALDYRLRQTGELRDLDAVRSVGGAGLHLVQEHDLVVPLLNVHGDVADAVSRPASAVSSW